MSGSTSPTEGVPAEAAEAADTMVRLPARTDLVLTLPARDDVTRFRRWATDELRRRLGG